MRQSSRVVGLKEASPPVLRGWIGHGLASGKRQMAGQLKSPLRSCHCQAKGPNRMPCQHQCRAMPPVSQLG